MVQRNGRPRPEPPKGASGSTLRALVRALRHRNYRLFFSGQSISLIGTWMTRIATSWLIYRLTGSALLLGVLGFAGQVPTFLLAPVAGVVVDRLNRHHVLVVTQVLAMIQSAALAVLTLTGVITVAQVVALSVFQGLINAFDMPARQSLVPFMVDDRADLANAIALNSSMVNAARLIGPSIAGVLIAVAGEGVCFLADAFSYLAVIVSLLAMHMVLPVRKTSGARVLAELSDGFRYAMGFIPIRAILGLLALVSLMGMPYVVLMPIIATTMLGGGAHTLGFLMAASGFGALIGALYLASRRSVLGLGRLIPVAATVFGLGIVMLSRSHALWLSLCVMPIIGGGMMVQMAASNTVLQTIVEEEKRGRVMSFYAMSFAGMAPFGSLLAGALGQRYGAPLALLVGGVACVAGAAAFFHRLPTLRRLVHPVYVKLGIIPEIATGLQSASQLTRPPEN
jgi:MFS family permease